MANKNVYLHAENNVLSGEFGFGICSEYEGGFVFFWRNETRRALCAFWLSSREGGLLLLFTVKLGRTWNLYHN